MSRCLAIATVLLLATACAEVSVRPVANAHGSSGVTLGAQEAGVRFYRPALHVWITASPLSERINVIVDEKKIESKGPITEDKTTQTTTATVPAVQTKGYSAQLVMLPDYSQEYAIQWKTGLGNVNPNFTLTEGWNLTAFNSRADSQAAELIKAATGSVTSLVPLAAGLLRQDPDFKGAGLYRLEVGTNGRLSLGELVLGLE